MFQHEPIQRNSARLFGPAVVALVLGIALVSPVAAQGDSASANRSGEYHGPRIGLTYLSQGVLDRAAEKKAFLKPVILQFGWQWEQRFVIGPQAPTLASAIVFVAGGAEQGVLIPSLSWILGVRGTNGGEFGIGPVVSLTGVNLAIAAGVTKRYGDVYVPWNLVLVTGKPGVRLSLLTGFNMNRRRLN